MGHIQFRHDGILGSKAAIRDEYSELTFSELEVAVDEKIELLPKLPSLFFFFIRNRVEDVILLLACLEAGHTVALLDPSLPAAARSKLDGAYEPNFVIQNCEVVSLRNVTTSDVVARDSELLLSTSGSTGSPKFVRLSATNLSHNAAAIALSQELVKEDIGFAHLPLHYSYGLSVLTSHLSVGSQVVLSDAGLNDGNFWSWLKDSKITHFPGVPFHYQFMARLGLDRLKLHSVTKMTQAGGSLSQNIKEQVHTYMMNKQGKFFVMYGQTEASPRITTLHHDDFLKSPHSVGRVLSGGTIHILNDSLQHASIGEEGEVIYTGPNVMLGYATSREDLWESRNESSVLATGDMGFIDNDGFLTITGRVKRFTKVFGLRVNLDEVEKALANRFEFLAVVGTNDRLGIFLPESARSEESQIKVFDALKERFVVPRVAVTLVFVDNLPILSSNKIDYRSLERQLNAV
jgi:acyl-CoA synthetase (AMP-forming)/AMP-acid ligase II